MVVADGRIVAFAGHVHVIEAVARTLGALSRPAFPSVTVKGKGRGTLPDSPALSGRPPIIG